MRAYFRANETTLPQSLENEYMIVADVRMCVNQYITQIEKAIADHGKSAYSNAPARAAWGNLERLYGMIQDESTHREQMLKVGVYKNK